MEGAPPIELRRHPADLARLLGSGVLLLAVFRLVTYWLPVVPGYVCLRCSRTAELV